MLLRAVLGFLAARGLCFYACDPGDIEDTVSERDLGLLPTKRQGAQQTSERGLTPIESTSTTRPGCSERAERNNPTTAACPRLGDSPSRTANARSLTKHKPRILKTLLA